MSEDRINLVIREAVSDPTGNKEQLVVVNHLL